MPPRPISCALASAVALCACAGQPRPVARVDMQQACAADITTMSAHPLRPAPASPEGKQAKPPPMMDFASIGQCVATPSGRIPAALFKLEGARLPVQISLGIAADADATLAAAATLLDSHHQPIRRYGFDRFSRRGIAYTIDIFVNETDADATYLLLSPDATWVGKQDVGLRAGTNTYASYGPVFFSYSVGYEETMNRQLTDAGRLQIEIKPMPAQR